MKNTWRSKHFYGNKISEYGIENKRLDYKTLAQAFDAVLNNTIISATHGVAYWEQEHGFIDNSEEIKALEEEREELQTRFDNYEFDEKSEEYARITDIDSEIEELEEEEQDCHPEIFQYYIVSDNGAEIIKEFTNDPLFYNETLDMYVWGVTHWGTSWDYVLTDTILELN